MPYPAAGAAPPIGNMLTRQISAVAVPPERIRVCPLQTSGRMAPRCNGAHGAFQRISTDPVRRRMNLDLVPRYRYCPGARQAYRQNFLTQPVRSPERKRVVGIRAGCLCESMLSKTTSMAKAYTKQEARNIDDRGDPAIIFRNYGLRMSEVLSQKRPPDF